LPRFFQVNPTPIFFLVYVLNPHVPDVARIWADTVAVWVLACYSDGLHL